MTYIAPPPAAERTTFNLSLFLGLAFKALIIIVGDASKHMEALCRQ